MKYSTIKSVEKVSGSTFYEGWRATMQKITTEKGEVFMDNIEGETYGSDTPLGCKWEVGKEYLVSTLETAYSKTAWITQGDEYV